MFQINVETLTPSEAFPYLGWTIYCNNRNWATVYLNLQKDQKQWTMLARVIKRTGAMIRARGEMYKAVERSVLLYSSKSWLMTGEMLKVLTSFCHRAARWITGITDKYGACGEWEYPLVEEEMEVVGIHPIGVYINRRQVIIAERVV